MQNSRKDSGGQGDDFRADAPEAVFRAFAEAVSKDAEPLADQVKKLLDLVDAGKEAEAASFAATLSANLPSYLPEDPESATVLAEAMAEKYAQAWEAARGDGKAESNAMHNEFREEDHPRDEAGKFTDTAGDDLTGEDVVPDWITPVNDITDRDKLDLLVSDMKENGWRGRPILAINDDGEHWQALTGSHRIEAAKEAGISAKVVRLEEEQLKELNRFLEDQGSDFDSWMNGDDQEKSEWLEKAVESGLTSLREASILMSREDRENYR